MLAASAILRTSTRLRTYSRGLRRSISGVAFDIDGVLVHGGNVLPRARDAIRLLHDEQCVLLACTMQSGKMRIPFVFLTNGGGTTEAARARVLSQQLGIHVDAEQVILAHTPMKDLVETYGDKNVVISGHQDISTVAASYGFTRFITTTEYVHARQEIWPFFKMMKHSGDMADPTQLAKDIAHGREPVSAVVLINDPLDWGQDIQVLSDILRSAEGLCGSTRNPTQTQEVPLFVSANDMLWQGQYKWSRLGQGAFHKAFAAVYEELNGSEPTIQYYGKPYAITYDYAYKQLQRVAAMHQLPSPEPSHIYGIGDNPYSDIAGANGYGWKSILTRTGVFRSDDDNHHEHQADHVVVDVLDAVKIIADAHPSP